LQPCPSSCVARSSSQPDRFSSCSVCDARCCRIGLLLCCLLLSQRQILLLLNGMNPRSLRSIASIIHMDTFHSSTPFSCLSTHDPLRSSQSILHRHPLVLANLFVNLFDRNEPTFASFPLFPSACSSRSLHRLALKTSNRLGKLLRCRHQQHVADPHFRIDSSTPSIRIDPCRSPSLMDCLSPGTMSSCVAIVIRFREQFLMNVG